MAVSLVYTSVELQSKIAAGTASLSCDVYVATHEHSGDKIEIVNLSTRIVNRFQASSIQNVEACLMHPNMNILAVRGIMLTCLNL